MTQPCDSGHPTVELNQSTPTKQLPVPVNKENSNSSLGSPFIKAPFWAKTVNTSSKRNKEKVPAVVTSRELKNYFHKKEEEKRLKQREIEQQSESDESEEIIYAEISDDETFSNKDNEEESEEIIYAEISDDETFSNKDNEEEFLENRGVQRQEQPQLEKFYAVYYDEQFYIWRVVEILNEKVLLIFSRNVSEYKLNWPKRQNTDLVEANRLFYGPIYFVGQSLTITDAALSDLTTAYEQCKLNFSNI
ncbi:hypothetical protein QE152_g19046 [Popillia japonica]|uniref:Uncharacterized protein n=1 Tax=Popillia japonica TaxID=7064 RepID=A0AAW1L4L8_POPJA